MLSWRRFAYLCLLAASVLFLLGRDGWATWSEPRTSELRGAIAEQTVSVVLPPVEEDLNYVLGRLTGDGMWTYGWDNIGRLKSMTCKTAALHAASNVTAETVSFIY